MPCTSCAVQQNWPA